MSGPYQNPYAYHQDPQPGMPTGPPGYGYGGMQGYSSVQQPNTPSAAPVYPSTFSVSMGTNQGDTSQPSMYPNQGYGQPMDYSSGYGMPNPQGQGQGYHPHSGGPPADQAFAIPGLNAPGLNPLGVLAAGSNLFSGGQTWGTQYMQRVQQRMGWLSGGALNYHFAISNQYVMSKLMILLVPYLKKWSFSRQPEQIQGGQKYRPPRVDVNAPDLYIPLVSAWTYVTLLCVDALLLGNYKPDIYSKVWYAGCAWAVHSGSAWVLLRMMSLPSSLPWSELIAYTGYMFVPACCTLAVGMAAGKWAWWGAWLYGSFASAVFLVRTIKRVLFQEARSYGPNLTLTNYLLLGLAMMQFPLLLWLCSVQLPTWSLHFPTMVSPILSSPLAIPSPTMGSPLAAGGAMPPPLKL